MSAARATAQLPTKGVVDHVVDGDTIAIRFDDRIEKVRLIGIDTPEKRPSKRAALQSERSHRSLTAMRKADLAINPHPPRAITELCAMLFQ